MTNSRRNMLIAWSVVAVFAIVDLMWLPFSRLTFVPSYPFWYSLASCAGLGLVYAVLEFLSFRLRCDPSDLATTMRLIADRGRFLVHAFVFNMLFFTAFLTFTYLSASVAWPLRDAELAAIDRLIGFDWMGFLAFANASPIISQLLVLAYKSSALQLLLLYAFLAVAGYEERLAESLALLATTALLTGFFNLIVPAAGAFEFYSPPREAFSHFSSDAGTWHFDLLSSLRGQAAPVLDFASSEGLVTFPSFHTILAVITAYSLRDVPYLRFPVFAISTIVIVATLTEGGHHLIDLIAGLFIAIACIGILRVGLRPAVVLIKSECK